MTSDLIECRQNDGHRFRVDRTDLLVRFGCQKREDVIWMKKWPYQDQEPSPPWYAQAWNEATYWIATKFNDLRGKLGLGAAKQGS